MAAGIGLNSVIFSDRKIGGKHSFFASESTFFHQRLEHGGGGWGQELAGHFWARDFGKNVVWTDNGPVGRGMDPFVGVTDNAGPYSHESRGGNAFYTVGEVEIDRLFFQFLILGGMDEIRSPGQPGAGTFQAQQGFFDFRKRETGSAEEAEHALMGDSFDHFDGGDAIGHFAGDVREGGAVNLAHGGVAQIFGVDAREDTDGVDWFFYGNCNGISIFSDEVGGAGGF